MAMEKFTANLLNSPYLYRPTALPRMDTSYKIDEGYSEETRSQDELDSPMRLESGAEGMIPSAMRLAMDSMMSLSEEDRSGVDETFICIFSWDLLIHCLEFVYNVLQTLRTSSIAGIVERLRPHLHKDPVAYLPPEVTSEIFCHLKPSMLLDASRVSQSWRERTLDSRLWKQKFYSEGWDLELEELRSLEQSPPSPRKTRSRRAETHGEQRRQKKRIRAGSDVENATGQTALRESFARRQETQLWNEQNSTVEADAEQDSLMAVYIRDEEMHDADSDVLSSVPNTRNMARAPNLLAGESSMSSNGKNQSEDTVSFVDNQDRSTNTAGARRSSDTSMGTASQQHFDSEPPLITCTASGQPRLNYQQLYKQRRRLEDNWTACAYKSFQLPHRDHPEEAHSECVYTIQYIGRYLVSGSRDRTLRKWDLETQRLVGAPMQGHSASVLCLQFDNSKEEDIIISGSSDTDVIIWRYSTGELIERISQAHREPVLNLKFDARFLVTCSKDKTIKIWNRHKLSPGDQDYPVKGVKGGGRCPAYIVDLSTIGANPFDIYKSLTPEQREPLREYTNLMTLDSHSAAVNAIHIYKDQLVSASGDRFVKVWNIHTGECTATCRGHQKGIACVQYDGKRIISGSSDNTIRIYDPATQGEVACLQGHTRLVRTIQSAFEDLPGSRDQLEKEAQEVDGQFLLAHEGKFPEGERSRKRNPGSNHPKDITAFGVKLPPGGGGSRWGRIVSGSYDETIIIWRKTSDGRWVPGHRLRQEEALRAAGGPLASLSDPQPAQNLHVPFAARRHANAQRASTAQQAQPHVNEHVQQANTVPQIQAHHWQQAQQALQSLQQPPMLQPVPGIAKTTQHPRQPSPSTRALKRAQTNPPPSAEPEASSSHATTSQTANPLLDRPLQASTDFDSNHGSQATQAFQPSQQQQQLQYHHQQHQHHRYQNQRQVPSPSQPTNPQQLQQPPTLDTQPPPPSSLQQSLVPQQNAQHPPPLPNPSHPTLPPAHSNPNPPQAAQDPHPHPHAPHHHHAATGPPGGPIPQPNARVFKLQFDSRRIICCSQDPKIVGWDFANGDERIIEASRFFKAPQ